MNDDKNNVEPSAVEDHDGILTFRGGGPQRNWNGIHYKRTAPCVTACPVAVMQAVFFRGYAS